MKAIHNTDKLESISLVIPAHNSADIIAESLGKYSDFLSNLAKRYEIIVSCNACTDNTEQLALEQAKRDRNIEVISTHQRGKGVAVIEGLKKAQYEIIGFIDADCVFKLDKVADMIHQLDNYDCVIASKWLGRNVFEISEPFTRKILAVGWKALTLILLHMRFHDTQAGAKFMKKRAFDGIDKNFICAGFDFDIELLYKLKKEGYSIGEFNIPVLKTSKFSTFRLKFLPAMFWHLFKLWSKTIPL